MATVDEIIETAYQLYGPEKLTRAEFIKQSAAEIDSIMNQEVTTYTYILKIYWKYVFAWPWR